ncbi:hypothetical protein BGX31_009426 [Mortierella sp. GBA43]|nr:hypothetical protein BGX31_009426 [Mortierella sp. GBA43]
MTSSNGFTDPNVEDMSNAELFQYLFKAELDSDLPAILPEALFHDMDMLDLDSQEQEQSSTQQVLDFQPITTITQVLPLQSAPTLLPSTSFSFRQLTPDMPPAMPAASVSLSTLDTTIDLTALSASKAPSDQMTFWMQRFQQLHQLPSSDSSNASDKDVVYPSPPMRDEMSMDSDDEDGPGQDNGPDPLKPSASELKKMTSKERRQLRNKLSARNFRVRRKEYISSLEAQVKEARKEAAELQKKLAQSELNCQFLRQELETTRLSQTLFNDGRSPMSREHANLLASLLNPHTESFPTATTTTTSPNTIMSVTQQQQQQRELVESINHNNMTILNNPYTLPQVQSSSDATETSLQPFVPFDGNWELIVNRAETIVDPAIDPKDVQSKEAVYNDLLTRYEAARREAEVDEQMRTEIKAYHEKRLEETYIVMPKEESLAMVNRTGPESIFLQTMVYMMMMHLTRSLFEAATLSKSQLVDVYQTMDQPLRSKMGREQKERAPCKFSEWREAWIKKCWPSYYNNRQRVCELLKNGLCPSSICSSGVDVDATVRQMEEGVKDKTVVQPMCVRLRACIASWLRCPDQVAREEREALMRESNKATLEVIA